MSLAPLLTPLDEHVLAQLDQRVGRRATIIANRARLNQAETRLILRGLEAIGRAEQHGGWWRRAA